MNRPGAISTVKVTMPPLKPIIARGSTLRHTPVFRGFNSSAQHRDLSAPVDGAKRLFWDAFYLFQSCQAGRHQKNCGSKPDYDDIRHTSLKLQGESVDICLPDNIFMKFPGLQHQSQVFGEK